MDNKKVSAKANAVNVWAEEWGLTTIQALVKFNHQDKKWQKKQVNKFLRRKPCEE